MSWNELLKITNVGTDRISTEIQFGNDNIYSFLKKIPFKNNEEKILNYSSSLAIYQEAGKKPNKLEEEIILESVLEENREKLKFSSVLFEKIFSEISEYNSYFINIQQEFFKELIKKNKVISDKYILKFLEGGAKTKYFQPYMSKILPKEALFISTKNPSWNYLYDIDADIEKIWINANKKTKLAILENNIKENPNLILKILKDNWDNLKKEEKEDILDLINKNKLVQDFKPIFELALNDRSKDVKTKASEYYLVKNKESDSMNEEIFEFISKVLDSYIKIDKIKSSGLYKIKIDTPPSSAYNKKILDFFRIEGNKVNEIHFFYAYIISKIPLNYWETRFNLGVEEIIAAFIRNDLKNYLHHISFQVINEKNVFWAKLLFENNINTVALKELLDDSFKKEQLTKVLNSLPYQDVENRFKLDEEVKNGKVLVETEKNLYNSYNHAINNFFEKLSNLMVINDSFNLEESKKIVDAFIIFLQNNAFHSYIVQELANRLDYNIFTYFEEQLELFNINKENNRFFFDSIYRILELRYKMFEEFKK
ncbi:MAG: DUF5691 domain-containing protein [Candidatus Sericytochromatia bacterium]